MKTESTINRVVQARVVDKGWQVTFAGMGINLALGILYSWSVMAQFLRESMNWTAISSQLPYMIACGVFAILMIPGGRMQDKLGPRVVLMASAIFAGLGLIGSSFFLSVAGLAIFFGIFFGTAMGLGYSSTTPAAIKWFGPEKRGLVTGLVVSGFGMASVYAAPLSRSLLTSLGMSTTFLILGISFLIIMLLLVQFISNPPANYVPAGTTSTLKKKMEQESSQKDYEWHEMLKTPQFYFIWFMFCFGSLAGLMVIGQLSSIALEQANLSLGFVLVAILAIFNAGGRIIGGIMFDKIGRTKTLFIIFSIQAINFLLFGTYNTLMLLLIGTVIAGFCYGACLSVFPSITAGFFGVKNLGVNYGLVFVAWGAGGVFGGLTGGLVRDLTGTYLTAYMIAALLCIVGTVMAFFIKAPQKQI
ncbi:MAG: OFA family MFS transporter [Bacillota bacterium]|nr:OFA family MFS transporter [Bacillota bacterium]